MVTFRMLSGAEAYGKKTPYFLSNKIFVLVTFRTLSGAEAYRRNLQVPINLLNKIICSKPL